MKYRYSLEKGSKKHTCPQCQKKKFVRFVDNSTKEYLPHQYGRCDSESSCGYYYAPKKQDLIQKTIVQTDARLIFEFPFEEELKNKVKVLGTKFDGVTKKWFFDSNTITKDVEVFAEKNNFVIIKSKPKHLERLIPWSVLYSTLNNYNENEFIQNLWLNYDTEGLEHIVSEYYLGTISEGYLKTGVTFPFIDIDKKIRAIQVKTFDSDNHTLRTNWVHSLDEFKSDWTEDYKNNESIVSCLFGEHLLKVYPDKPIALVEAPKTAITASLHFGKDFLWLAVFNKSSLKLNKLKVLNGRTVRVFPDLGAFEDWSKKIESFQTELPDTKFIMDTIIEKLATPKQRQNGADIADFILDGTLDDHQVV